MIETTTIRPAKIHSNNSANGIQPDNQKVQSFRPQQFQAVGSKNPCHDGCNVTEKQLQASRGETTAIEKTDNSNPQSASTEKASGGNCPGSNLIANILQQLIGALEASRIGR